MGDKHESISHKSIKVKKGKKASFTIKAKKGYRFSKLVAGTCPTGKWKKNKYTTGTITKKCKLYFSAGRVGSRMVQVTPTAADLGVKISPNKAEKILTATLAQFKVTPQSSGDSISRTVGGTCPKGVWLDTIYYKIGPVKHTCTVIFSSESGSGGGNYVFLPKWVDAAGNIYVTDTGNYILRKIDALTQFISTIAVQPNSPGDSGDNGSPTSALLTYPRGSVVDSLGNLYIADGFLQRYVKYIMIAELHSMISSLPTLVQE